MHHKNHSIVRILELLIHHCLKRIPSCQQPNHRSLHMPYWNVWNWNMIPGVLSTSSCEQHEVISSAIHHQTKLHVLPNLRKKTMHPMKQAASQCSFYHFWSVSLIPALPLPVLPINAIMERICELCLAWQMEREAPTKFTLLKNLSGKITTRVSAALWWPN